MKLSQFKALIFDMDGVFVDTEPIVFDVFRAVFDPLGIHLTDEYMYQFIGLPTSKNFYLVENDFGQKLDHEFLKKDLIEKYDQILPQRITDAQQGVWPLVERARQNRLHLALCTTSGRRDVEVIFNKILTRQQFTFETLFDASITGDEIGKRKPDPAPYLKVIELLNQKADIEILPQECMVIEDSPTGATAAKRAGCYCLALQQPYNRHCDFSMADTVIERLEDIL